MDVAFGTLCSEQFVFRMVGARAWISLLLNFNSRTVCPSLKDPVKGLSSCIAQAGRLALVQGAWQVVKGAGRSCFFGIAGLPEEALLAEAKADFLLQVKCCDRLSDVVRAKVVKGLSIAYSREVLRAV